jgi:hypothetical protein
MTCSRRYRNRQPVDLMHPLLAALLCAVFLSSCAELPPKFRVSKAEGNLRAAVVHFEQGWRMPELAEACQGHWYCETAAFGSTEWKEAVVTLECRCEKAGLRQYGVLAENSYLINKTTFEVRPGGEDRMLPEFRLPRGGGSSDHARYAQRDGDWLIVRGTRIRFPGKFGEYPGVISSDTVNRLATLSYDAFARETYGLFPHPSHLIGYAHKGTFYIAVYHVDLKQEIGVVEIRYQGLSPGSFRPHFYGDSLLFKLLLSHSHGIFITWDE